MQITAKNIEELPKAAEEFLAAIPAGTRLIAFSGEMGAGKTTFIAELARQLGTDDAVGSPTFAIVNDYHVQRPGAEGLTKPGDSIYHFDFYRLDEPQDALEIGIYDYFDSDFFCLMEWPDRIGNILPDETLNVSIEVDPISDERLITF